jgi:prevent-host-death family protein
VFDTNRKGTIAEAEIEAAAVRLGIPVLKPVAEHGRYDLGFEIGTRLLRVQCKWGSLDQQAAVIRVNLQGSWWSQHGYVRTSYREDEIDLVAVYCDEVDRCYLLPSKLVAGRRAIYLRLKPPRNSQRACLNLASAFEFTGAVAQWNERPAGSRKVVGSNPTSSTRPSGQAQRGVVGAHEFRNLFGHFIERAGAGDEFLITRHGRPLARLLPAAARS